MEELIKDRYLEVHERIVQACKHAGRAEDDVKLVIVTKGQPAEKVIEVVHAGAQILGENYPEETLQKVARIGQEINPVWHMIGHLQSRKIKLLYSIFTLIHSVDSLELAAKLDHFYALKGEVCDALIEVNISGEASKYGFSANSIDKRNDLLKFFDRLAKLDHLRIKGLMTMPPLALTEGQNEECYNLCHELLYSIQTKFKLESFNQLSMGTSADFETAIKCGSTYVRIGEAIMGKRHNL